MKIPRAEALRRLEAVTKHVNAHTSDEDKIASLVGLLQSGWTKQSMSQDPFFKQFYQQALTKFRHDVKRGVYAGNAWALRAYHNLAANGHKGT